LSFQPHALARHRTGQGRAQRGGAKCREPLTRRDLEHAGAGRARQHDGFGLQACAAIGVASSHPLIAISRATRDPGKRSTRQTAPLEPALWRPPVQPKKLQLTAASRTKSLSRLNSWGGRRSPTWDGSAVARSARRAAPKLDLRRLAGMTTAVSRFKRLLRGFAPAAHGGRWLIASPRRDPSR